MQNLNNHKFEKPIFVVYGATASGKSDFAINLAHKIDAVLINADSVQVYEDSPILSNMPSVDDMLCVPHKLFSFLPLDYNFSVGRWLELVKIEINQALLQKKRVIIVGGTGLYISSLLNGISSIPSNPVLKQESINLFNKIGYDKFYEIINKIDPVFCNKFKDPQRLMRAYEVYLISQKPMSLWQKKPKMNIVDHPFTKVFINKEKPILDKNIILRVKKILKQGAIYEVETIIKKYHNELLLKKILGAVEINLFLKKQLSYSALIEQVIIRTRQYAKRQNTWFKNQINHSFMIQK